MQQNSTLKTDAPAPGKTAMSPWMIASSVLGALITFLFHFGAARLSYLKYQSVGWAILDFFFALFYYPYYALVLAGPVPPPATMFGGMKGLLKMLR